MANEGLSYNYYRLDHALIEWCGGEVGELFGVFRGKCHFIGLLETQGWRPVTYASGSPWLVGRPASPACQSEKSPG